jgi:hypothetical protein
MTLLISCSFGDFIPENWNGFYRKIAVLVIDLGTPKDGFRGGSFTIHAS